ncbi:glycoside hydrolase family 55 protein [Halothece sp. PCC 7418]|uniref:glycoside hydrolase family 55 protein n=1 Tax=Halothece sp. (strain PCC 7418) TaxID=65093 RepID=UPI0002DB08E6|nr:glycoside hydrolase family 55 protein [Halothece sp. PCC 7418]
MLISLLSGCASETLYSSPFNSEDDQLLETSQLLDHSPTLPQEKQFPNDIGWINIKQDYGAKGDGKTDDTQAIQKALATPYSSYNRPKLIYFPKGTYLVSDTLQFPAEGMQCCVTFQGQGRDNTIIKLKDNLPAYRADAAAAVIRTRAGNIAFRNYIRDLTVNTGRGNPGAVGIDYISNNRGAIKDVTIKSEDGQGRIGLSMLRQWPGPSLIKNVSIEGFDVGIRTFHSVYGMVFENINLSNQNEVGLQNTSNTIAIRNLKSNNSVPVIHNVGNGLTILLNGEFQGGSSSVSAINNRAYIYARNVTAQGYQSAIQNWDHIVPDLYHREYIFDRVDSLFDAPKHSLQLPIEETPVFHDNNLNHWANVKDYPSVQAAMNSGHSTIYFPRGDYPTSGFINIPDTVKKIIGFESRLGAPKNEKVVFQITDKSTDPLIIEGFILNERVTIQHASPRTLALKYSQLQGSLLNSKEAGKLFLEDVQTELHLDYPQQVWARQLNIETLSNPRTKISNNGGNLWILGLKTEGKGSVIETTNGGQTELLGTVIYPVRKFTDAEQKTQAAFVNENSNHSLIYSLSAASAQRNYQIQVKEIRNGETKVFLTEDLPSYQIPLFVGYNNN